MIQRRLLTRLLVLGCLASGACGDREAMRRPATTEERAADDVLARRMVDAIGGDAFWRLRLVSFDWVVRVLGVEVKRHHHDWDVHGGMVRVTWDKGDERKEVLL